MLKEMIPGVAAFVVLVSLVVATIVGFRLYQVSNVANQLLTGQCSVIGETALEALAAQYVKDLEKAVADVKAEFTKEEAQ